jgi:DNA-binding transcriptional regulator YdaS (Cro superfamily)
LNQIILEIEKYSGVINRTKLDGFNGPDLFSVRMYFIKDGDKPKSTKESMTISARPTSELIVVVRKSELEAISTSSIQSRDHYCRQSKKLAKLIKKTPGHITVWVNRDKRAPADMAIPIEEVTGVSRHLLRPDIFGAPPESEKPVAA